MYPGCVTMYKSPAESFHKLMPRLCPLLVALLAANIRIILRTRKFHISLLRVRFPQPSLCLSDRKVISVPRCFQCDNERIRRWFSRCFRISYHLLRIDDRIMARETELCKSERVDL